jgi:hypothetical protein
MALVLCTGVEQSLLRTRKLILEKAGHTVLTAIDQRDVVAACRKHSFNVAVIGQTVSTKSKRAISSLVRQHCPSARILELYQANHGPALPDGEADSWLEVPTDVPQDLAAHVSKLATRGPAKSG